MFIQLILIFREFVLFLLVYPLVVTLGERVHYRYHKVQDHGKYELLEDGSEQVASFGYVLGGFPVELDFLAVEESFERFLELVSYYGQYFQPGEGGCYKSFVEGDDNEQFLDVHLDDGFSDEGCSEEGPEWHQEVTAGDACEIEEWIRDLKKKKRDFQMILLIV